MNSVLRALWWFGFLALLAGPLLAADLTGKLVATGDGDTLTLLPPPGYPVVIKGGIRADQRNLFRQRLGGQQAVEGVFMVKRHPD